MKKSYIIGIAGGSASGKSTFSEKLEKTLDMFKVKVIHMDNYFKTEKERPHPQAPITKKIYVDDNHPESMDLPKLKEDLAVEVSKNIYDVIIVEGLMTLHDDNICGMLDLKLFVDCQSDERIVRRLKRNMAWGQTFDEISDVYLDMVRYRHNEYVEPSKWKADFILNGSSPSEKSLKIISESVKSFIMKPKILIICDDIYHHGEIIKEGLSFLQDEYELTYATDISEYSFTDNPLSGYNAVILAKENITSKSDKTKWLTEDIEKQFEDYANNGGGLIFLHAGSVICRESAVLKNIAGCAFVNHPEQCVVDFKIISGHEIISGAEEFSEKDEHYFIDFTAADAEIFLESCSENGIQNAGYTRIHNNNGHVCVLTPGHNLPVLQNEQYRKMIRNAVNWCAK